MALAQSSFGGFADDGESLVHHIVEWLAVLKALAKLGRLSAQLVIVHGLVFRLQRVNRGNVTPDRLDRAVVGGAEYFHCKVKHCDCLSYTYISSRSDISPPSLRVNVSLRQLEKQKIIAVENPFCFG